MKAYVLNKIGDLSYQDVPKPELKKDWALIKVKAAGICSSDIPRIMREEHTIFLLFLDTNLLETL